MTWTTLRDHACLKFNTDVELEGRIEYDARQHALAIVDPVSGEEEVLTVDLLSAGYLAFPGEVFVKDWSEHTGLAFELAQHGIAEMVEAVGFGQFHQTAYRMRVREGLLTFPTEASHSRLAVLLPQTEEEITRAHRDACTAARGDSNDDEIERLWELVETLMGALQISGQIRP